MTRYREAIRPVIHWFRKDLRLADNPALLSAAESGHPVLAVYILEDLSLIHISEPTRPY